MVGHHEHKRPRETYAVGSSLLMTSDGRGSVRCGAVRRVLRFMFRFQEKKRIARLFENRFA